MTQIKVCGFTRVPDVRAAIGAGVDALGFNFAVGPRKISPALGKELIRHVPGLNQSVGLFVDQSKEFVRDTMRHTGCQVIQLHGDESAADICWLARFFPVIKAYRIRRGEDLQAIPQDLPLAGVLLDAWCPTANGGTGQVWDYALLQNQPLPYPIILAGGLQPNNVAEAITTVRPYAVDTASGVESAPGVKDHRALARFVAAVRAAG